VRWSAICEVLKNLEKLKSPGNRGGGVVQLAGPISTPEICFIRFGQELPGAPTSPFSPRCFAPTTNISANGAMAPRFQEAVREWGRKTFFRSSGFDDIVKREHSCIPNLTPIPPAFEKMGQMSGEP